MKPAHAAPRDTSFAMLITALALALIVGILVGSML